MPNNIPYKSFCWGLGTTSFRTKNFNKTIEEQLALLDEFWDIEGNSCSLWKGNDVVQTAYYDFMKEKGFVIGEANNKPKDAREKTSGLVDVGFIGDDRRLTAAGLKLLEISKANDFETDNVFQIPKDSYVYLKQLLKTCNDVNGKFVRPFVVMLYVLSKVDYLSTDEFKYLLPLCVDAESTEFIIQQIHRLRTNDVHIDDIIIERLMSMDNYQTALQMFIDNDVDEDLICTVGMNRKSRSYDRTYYPLYLMLRRVFIGGSTSAIGALYEATKQIKIGKYWRSYLFDTTSILAIDRNPIEHLNHSIFSNVGDEVGLKVAFFKIMHLFKAKATLSDYLDLNRRYIKTTDVILFEDDMVKMDVVPKQFFASVMDGLYTMAFTKDNRLQEDCSMEEIAKCLIVNEKAIVNGLNKEFKTHFMDIAEAYSVVEERRYRRLQHLIDTKFTDEKLLALLDCFERRNDNEIYDMVTDNADVPTIFEYILGILWYKASDRQGKILDYMKLSIDADLLPKTHAAGGEADIVYEYDKTEYYPEHTLLLEATLADGTNQRRMEMEPVSRHLGKHLIRTGNMNSYCVFATTYLDINVISDFRSRKTTPYYDTGDYTKHVDGMKIIPLDTGALKVIVQKEIKYKSLFDLFDKAYNSTTMPHEWYNDCILRRI